MPISVLLADDHDVVRRGVRALLEADGGFRIVGEVSDGRQIVSTVARLKPDVLLLDLTMPGMSGFDALKALGARSLATRTVVLSMHAKDEYVAEALQHGATAYVVKTASGSEIVAAIKSAAAGRRYLSAPLSAARVRDYLRNSSDVSADPFETLSAREREVLQLAVKGLTNSEIARRLAIGRRTAETHRSNLMRKLGLKGEKDLIRYALRRGLLDDDGGA